MISYDTCPSLSDLTSLSLIISRSIHVAASGKISSFFYVIRQAGKKKECLACGIPYFACRGHTSRSSKPDLSFRGWVFFFFYFALLMEGLIASPCVGFCCTTMQTSPNYIYASLYWSIWLGTLAMTYTHCFISKEPQFLMLDSTETGICQVPKTQALLTPVSKGTH